MCPHGKRTVHSCGTTKSACLFADTSYTVLDVSIDSGGSSGGSMSPVGGPLGEPSPATAPSPAGGPTAGSPASGSPSGAISSYTTPSHVSAVAIIIEPQDSGIPSGAPAPAPVPSPIEGPAASAPNGGSPLGATAPVPVSSPADGPIASAPISGLPAAVPSAGTAPAPGPNSFWGPSAGPPDDGGTEPLDGANACSDVAVDYKVVSRSHAAYTTIVACGSEVRFKDLLLLQPWLVASLEASSEGFCV